MPLERLGPYKLEKVLGRGGMGAVYVGLNDETGERAAVKVLSGHLADDTNFRERFKQEIETLKRLLHPNIVQLFGYGEEDGHLFYVMELVSGRSLQEEIAAGRRFSWREVARIGVGVAQALKHAHDRGIIHRDLKPANLLMDASDHVKLTDFGIAKLYGGTNVTAEGGVLGTADYMAPEQAEGKQPTSRCDLYALGSVMYALLTGRPPFVGRTIYEVMSALQKEPPTPVRRLAPDTPAEFENIILQLLHKDPHQRIPTALALANRLKAMEHALSLETRVLDPLDDQPEVAEPLPDEALPSSAKTASANVNANPTLPIELAQSDEYRLASDAPTLATDARGGQSNLTRLGTQADKRTGAGESGRKTDSDQPAAPSNTAAAALARFTTVSEAELRGARETDETPVRQWLLVGGLLALAAVLIAGVALLATRPPSADRLFASVQAAADSGPDELVLHESDLVQFLQHHSSDPRAAEVRAWQDDMEQYQLQKQLERRARRPSGAEGLTPAERAYLAALRMESSDPEAALARYEAIASVYGGPPDPALNPIQQRISQQCIALARQAAERLRPTAAKLNAEEKQAVRRQLERADKLATTDRAAAEKVWRGIDTLYASQPWASDLVAEARAKLAESP
ncbi:MAG TPA: serine/threonine-protein kinase [Pirellulaceae bacterium]|nr:serine/threonine-protein kinase [Pirellulaceae bacterium]